MKFEVKKLGKIGVAIFLLVWIVAPDALDFLNFILPGAGFIDDATAGGVLIWLIRSFISGDKEQKNLPERNINEETKI